MTQATLEQERQKRIVTTHVGSLPRPDALSHMMADGDTHSPAYSNAVREAVTTHPPPGRGRSRRRR